MAEHAIGAGTMKAEDQRRMLGEWRKAARAPAQKRQTMSRAQTHEALRYMGIGVRVKKKRKPDGE